MPVAKEIAEHFFRLEINHGTCSFIHLLRRHTRGDRRRRYGSFDVYIRAIFRKLIAEEFLTLNFDTRQRDRTPDKFICKLFGFRFVEASFIHYVRGRTFALVGFMYSSVRHVSLLFDHSAIPLCIDPSTDKTSFFKHDTR